MSPETEIRLTVPLAQFWRARKKSVSNLLQCVSHPAIRLLVMPNQHSPDKICLSAWIERDLHRRVLKAAKAKGMTLTEYAEHLYAKATRDIELTAEDYREIAEAIDRAKRKSSGGASSDARKTRKTGQALG